MPDMRPAIMHALEFLPEHGVSFEEMLNIVPPHVAVTIRAVVRAGDADDDAATKAALATLRTLIARLR